MTLNKQVVEANYLTAPNYYRYRSILRFFYRQHQKLTYWMAPEEVVAYLQQEPDFKDYTLEQCQQDLSTLVNWNNLIAIQDAGRVQTIEEFKNRRFRYQLTPYTIEFERLTIKLESISGVGGSLEANLFERIAGRISGLDEQVDRQDSDVHAWWQDLSADFQRLNENATDYIANLHSSQLEQLISTTAFLSYKDKIVDYLRTFIRELQRCGPMISHLLDQTQEDHVSLVLEKICRYEKQIPRLGQVVDEVELWQEMYGQWNSLVAWFVGNGSRESEAERLLAITNGIIRRITRYAYRLVETQTQAISRQREYLHLARLFTCCEDVNKAHSLAAVLFGPESTRHLCGEYDRSTDSISSGVFAEPAFHKQIKPKVRRFSERSMVEGIADKQDSKRKALEEYLKLQQEEELVINRYIQDQTIDFAQLPLIEPFVRTALLRWLGKALATPELVGKTEDGRTYRVEVDSGEPIIVKCSDGDFTMPPVKIKFEQRQVLAWKS